MAMTSGLYYKSRAIVIYDQNDTTIVLPVLSTIILANLA
jgi:hypothetical protein